MKTILYFLFCLFTVAPSLLYGADAVEYGTHGGFLRKSGSFKIELVNRAKEIRVYLLDNSNQNPMTEASSVSIEYVGKTKAPHKACAIKNDYFLCKKPKTKFKGVKQIVIHAQRETKEVKQTIFPLPFPKPNSVDINNI